MTKPENSSSVSVADAGLAEKLKLALKAIQSSIRYSPYDRSLQEAFSKIIEVIAALESSTQTPKNYTVESGSQKLATQTQEGVRREIEAAFDRFVRAGSGYSAGQLRMDILKITEAKK